MAGAVTLAALLGVIAAAVTGGIGASAAPKPPSPAAPTITGGPTGTVNDKSASFTFTHPTSGVAFQCSLDGGSYSSCTSPKAYSNLSETTHTFRVTATQGSSDQSAAASRTWTVLDTTPPPSPTITQAPDGLTDKTKAKFQLGDSESGVTFQCALGDATTVGTYSSCEKNVQYSGLTPDEYCFRTKAKDPAGNTSDPSKFCWTNFEKQAFGITGSVSAPLYPGTTQPLDLSFSNPNNSAIKVLDVTVAVSSNKSACSGSNLDVLQGGSTKMGNKLTFSNVTIPAGSTKKLSQLTGVTSAELVSIRFPNTSGNQDACKSTTFTFTYTGTAGKA